MDRLARELVRPEHRPCLLAVTLSVTSRLVGCPRCSWPDDAPRPPRATPAKVAMEDPRTPSPDYVIRPRRPPSQRRSTLPPGRHADPARTASPPRPRRGPPRHPGGTHCGCPAGRRTRRPGPWTDGRGRHRRLERRDDPAPGAVIGGGLDDRRRRRLEGGDEPADGEQHQHQAQQLRQVAEQPHHDGDAGHPGAIRGAPSRLPSGATSTPARTIDAVCAPSIGPTRSGLTPNRDHER